MLLALYGVYAVRKAVVGRANRWRRSSRSVVSWAGAGRMQVLHAILESSWTIWLQALADASYKEQTETKPLGLQSAGENLHPMGCSCALENFS